MRNEWEKEGPPWYPESGRRGSGSGGWVRGAFVGPQSQDCAGRGRGGRPGWTRRPGAHSGWGRWAGVAAVAFHPLLSPASTPGVSRNEECPLPGRSARMKGGFGPTGEPAPAWAAETASAGGVPSDARARRREEGAASTLQQSPPRDGPLADTRAPRRRAAASRLRGKEP